MADKTTTENKAAKPADRPRIMHLLVLPVAGESNDLADFEPFTGEIAARRELDNRPGWRYVAITPGTSYRTRIAPAAKP